MIAQKIGYQSKLRFDPLFASVRPRMQSGAINLALALMLCTLWALMHRYRGLSFDAQLYAVQALAKIHPALANDLYLQNISQEKFTLFSPVYATVIRLFGLQQAAILLSALFTVWFLAAAWALARNLINPDIAWLAVASLIITVGTYGAFNVFSFSENYLTARSLAEALVITALACHFRGFKVVGLLIAAMALLVHPLMALPGLLLLICLAVPTRVAATGAIAGVLAILGIAIFTIVVPTTERSITVLDAAWVEVVRERSKFLFLQLWSLPDWEANSRSFICLAVTAMSLEDGRIRRLCILAALVGASGLAIALIGSLIGPVAILVQGQAWRWVWITGFVSALLLVPTVFKVCQDKKCGLTCAMLLVAGWTFSEINGAASLSGALILWLMREHINARVALYLRWGSVVFGAVIAAWILANSWTYTIATFGFLNEPLFLQRLRNIMGLQIPAVLLVWLSWHEIRTCRSLWAAVLTCGALVASSAFLLHASFKQARSYGSASEIEEFKDWRNAIPPTSNVYFANGKDSPIFTWFTLGRPSYLSLDQSAGVIFSRATALEVKRRSEVLLPIMDPDWRLQSNSLRARSSNEKDKPSKLRALTTEGLISMCEDPLLGFVIARENVGFDPIRHNHSGLWKDWNLYDCSHVRTTVPAA